MDTYILSAAIGVVLIVLGIFNMKGNISSLHSYHRRRVSEADRLPFGRLVGLGTIIIGIALIVFSACLFAAESASLAILGTVGTAVLIVGLVVGLGLNFFAMIKYNKGIF